jgi:hypothetical protein
MYAPMLAKAQQEHAAHWHRRALEHMADAERCDQQGFTIIASVYRDNARNAQEYARYESHAARYHVGQLPNHPE